MSLTRQQPKTLKGKELNLLKRATLTITALLAITVPFSLPVSAASPTGIKPNLCAGANLQFNSDCKSGVTDKEAMEDFNRIVHNFVNLLSTIVGIVSVFMIMVGGLKYITSGGDSSKVTGAKNTIIYSLVGLIIVAFSQSIVRFVLNKATH